jgi:competence protein ComGC
MAKHKFKPGESGNPNGRPKGSVSKKTKEFMLMLEEKGFDPGQAYVELFQKQMELYDIRREKNPANISGANEILSAASHTLNNICQFVYPRKKAIEHSGEVGVKTFADFMAAAKGHKK